MKKELNCTKCNHILKSGRQCKGCVMKGDRYCYVHGCIYSKKETKLVEDTDSKKKLSLVSQIIKLPYIYRNCELVIFEINKILHSPNPEDVDIVEMKLELLKNIIDEHKILNFIKWSINKLFYDWTDEEIVKIYNMKQPVSFMVKSEKEESAAYTIQYKAEEFLNNIREKQMVLSREKDIIKTINKYSEVRDELSNKTTFYYDKLEKIEQACSSNPTSTLCEEIESILDEEWEPYDTKTPNVLETNHSKMSGQEAKEYMRNLENLQKLLFKEIGSLRDESSFYEGKLHRISLECEFNDNTDLAQTIINILVAENI